MAIGIITGSGTYALPDFVAAELVEHGTPYGDAAITRGTYAGISALHVSRHGAGHVRLSNHVTHRANIWALKDLGATAVIGCTACGAVDPTVPLGSLVVFDDLHFISNRLPDGSLCTFFTDPGDIARGHWILHGGPLASCGVTAVSQTGGPEVVLCGELELPYALIGFATDYANEVVPGEPTPVATLIELMGKSTAIFADVLRVALPRLASERASAAGTVYRFEQG
jgi:5'-methylthioadenosine phosphorylase